VVFLLRGGGRGGSACRIAFEKRENPNNRSLSFQQGGKSDAAVETRRNLKDWIEWERENAGSTKPLMKKNEGTNSEIEKPRKQMGGGGESRKVHQGLRLRYFTGREGFGNRSGELSATQRGARFPKSPKNKFYEGGSL